MIILKYILKETPYEGEEWIFFFRIGSSGGNYIQG
jgi:hypothetical protein